MKQVSLLILLLATALLYSVLLDRTPIHFNQDELGFSLNAYGVAKTGMDENGRFFPLYFWHLGVMWATPLIVYLTATVLKIIYSFGGTLNEVVVRFPSVIVGVVNVALIYFLALRIFKSEKWGLVAGILLATTPIHFIQSRILLDNLYIVPFVLGWLLLIVYFLESQKPFYLLLLGIALGFGFYSYHASRIMIPFYFVSTLFFLLPELKKAKRALLVIIGFIAPLLPLIPWTREYPETLFIDQVHYLRIGTASSLFSLESLSHRFDVFVSYFNPIYLFLLGDASLIHSTSLHHPLGLGQAAIRAGVFLLPLAVFIPLGIYNVLRKRDRLSLLILFGFLTAPIAGALAGDHYRYSRILVILPFAIILAVYGIKFLSEQKNKLLLTTYYLLLIFIPLHFFYFLYDYFTDYRVRSYAWMKYDIPGALETVIYEDAKSSSSTIYLDNRVGFIDRYWKFYLIKHDKLELADITQFIDIREADLETLDSKSIVMAEFNNVDGQMQDLGDFRKVATIREPDFVPIFYIYRN